MVMRDDSRSHALSVLARRIDDTLATLDSQLSEASGLDIDKLLAELQAEFNEITNLSAPIESLPNEVLSAVFEAGCFSPLGKVPDQRFELLVSSISRRWRNVAVTTPALWTQIHVLPEKPLNIYLMRSGALPLDIRADLRFGPRNVMFMEQVVPQIARWRSMYIQSNQRQHLYRVIRHICFVTAPLLQCLQISLEDHDNEEDDGRDVLIRGTPSLKSFGLKGIGLHSCIPPGSKLTTLHVHGASSGLSTNHKRFRDILDSLSMLTCLVIYGHVTDIDDSPTRPSVLPLLSSLHLLPTGSSGHASQIGLLAIISAPMLECLSLKGVQRDDIKGPLFRRPEWIGGWPRYPRLRALTITLTSWDNVIDKLTWATLHRVFPTITEFTLFESPVSSSIKTLTNDGGRNADAVSSADALPWWPDLRSLTLDYLYDSSAERLCALLSDRIAQGHPLRKLRFMQIKLARARNKVTFLDTCKQMNVEVEEFTIKTVGDRDGWYHDDD